MTRSRFYYDGLEEGEDVAHKIDWAPGEIQQAWERNRVGEIVGEYLESLREGEGSIYSDVGITDRQLDEYEDGFHAGFERGVYEQLGTRRRKRG